MLYIYLLEFREFGLKEIIVFENMNAKVEVVMDSIVWILLVWASREDFKGIPLQDMYGSWEVVFKGVASAIWVHPAIRVLKLNFNRNFLKDLHQGG